MVETIQWTEAGVVMIDQSQLPGEEVYVSCRGAAGVAAQPSAPRQRLPIAASPASRYGGGRAAHGGEPVPGDRTDASGSTLAQGGVVYRVANHAKRPNTARVRMASHHGNGIGNKTKRSHNQNQRRSYGEGAWLAGSGASTQAAYNETIFCGALIATRALVVVDPRRNPPISATS